MTKTVAIAGLGAIGLPLARALDARIDGLRLVAVACRDEMKGRASLAGFIDPPPIVALPELADADVVVEPREDAPRGAGRTHREAGGERTDPLVEALDAEQLVPERRQRRAPRAPPGGHAASRREVSASSGRCVGLAHPGSSTAGAPAPAVRAPDDDPAEGD